MKWLSISLIILLIFSINSTGAFCQSEKIFRTKYATIHYKDDKDIDDFIWRLGGQRFEFTDDIYIASSRVDRIVEKVQAILDMRLKKTSNIDVYLLRTPPNPDKPAALYEYKTRAIYVSIDNSSDGVFAHEVAHAVINQYFSPPPPSKIQEILTQYVDKYLWSDY